MDNLLFDLIFSEYQTLHPQPKFLEITRKMPKPQKIFTTIFLLGFLTYIAGLFFKLIWLAITGLTALMIIAFFLIRSVKKHNVNSHEIKKYRKNYIKPLRKVLQQHHLYNLAAIDFLIEKCSNKSKEETNFEKYLRISKTLLFLIIKYFLIITVILILSQVGAINIEQLEPTIEGVFSYIVSLFVIDYQSGILIAITILCVLLLFSVLHYSFCSLFDEFSSRKRKKICALIDDLKFIRIDFDTEYTEHRKFTTP